MLVLVGVAAAVVIRKVVRPARFEGSHLGEADFILLMIAGVVLTLLLWHAARIAAGLNEWPAAGPALGRAVAPFSARDATRERVFVWAHLAFVLAFLVYLPYSKHLHIATAGVERLLRPHARGAAGSSRCASTCPRTSCASAPGPSPT